MKSTSSAEHMKLLAVESTNADSYFQQLDKIRMVYEDYVKLKKETIPLAEKNLKDLTDDLNQKSLAFDDVSSELAMGGYLCLKISFIFVLFVTTWLPQMKVHFDALILSCSLLISEDDSDHQYGALACSL